MVVCTILYICFTCNYFYNNRLPFQRQIPATVLYFFLKIKKQYWIYAKWCIVFVLLHNVVMWTGIMNAEYGYDDLGNDYYTIIQIIKRPSE